MPLTLPDGATVLDALLTALDDAARFNSQVEAPPLALLWPDKNRDWETVMDRVRARRTVLTLGEYVPATKTGPALWIRAALSGELPEVPLEPGVPVVYLPGIGRAEIKAAEEAPRELAPLVYLHYRGVVLTQPNGTKDLTLTAFLQNKESGLGLTLAGAINDALAQTLDKLLEQRIEALRALDGGLRADWLHALNNPDLTRSLLRWIDDPDALKTDIAWASFREQVKSGYGLDPERESPLDAVRKLGEQLDDRWRTVWARYREAPRQYPKLPERLRAAKPVQTLTLFSTGEITWPQDNEAAEAALRTRLEALQGLDEAAARTEIAALDAEHGPRRASVWADLKQTPLANSLGHLARLAEESKRPIAGGTFDQIVRDYRERGWRVDAAMLDALAAVTAGPNRDAVGVAIRALYTGWLRASAINFQAAFPKPDEAPPVEIAPGTCLLFADGLRYDLGKRLEARLTKAQMDVELTSALAAAPSVTPTAKPACSPVAHLLTGGNELGLRIDETGAALTQAGFVNLLTKQGFAVLGKHESAIPAAGARGWTEFGEFDTLGHAQGVGMVAQIGSQLDALADRVRALLEGGWERVEVITDHGWLLLPGGLEKCWLEQHLTDVRKGRCARIKPTSSTKTGIQTVPWRWDPSVRIAVAPNITCFEEGKVYEHGGLSAQECVTPRLTVRRPGAPARPAAIEEVSWNGLRCVVKLAGAAEGMLVDLRWKAGADLTGDAKIAEPAILGDDQASVRLTVEDSAHEGNAAFVVLLDRTRQVIAQRHTTVGGED